MLAIFQASNAPNELKDVTDKKEPTIYESVARANINMVD
jgi:hypothetical protein